MKTDMELYQLVTPLARLGIWQRNLSNGTVYWNEIIREILEVEKDFQPGSEANVQFYKSPETVSSMINSVIQTGKPQQAELEMITATGSLKWVKVRMQVRTDERDSILLYGTLEDISTEVSARHLLEERQQLFSKAFENAPIGMTLVSINGQFLQANPSLCQLLGYQQSELAKLTFHELTHPDDLQADLMQYEQLLNKKITAYSLEKRYYHRDGHIIWALLSVSLVRDDKDLPLYFISQIKDITQQKRSTEIIEAQNARLLNFAHMVSHNLRSHASNIHMLAKLIREEADSSEKEVLTNMLSESSDNLLNTLEELNEIVKINNSGSILRQNINLAKELVHVANMLGAWIKTSNATIEIEVAEHISIDFNTAYFESIFINLISNSLKYRHPEHPPVIRISAEQTTDKVKVTLSDNGIGLDMELHGHKLFGMYKVFHGNHDARGIGLFLTKNHIEAMGGNIWAESSPNNGMIIHIEINR